MSHHKSKRSGCYCLHVSYNFTSVRDAFTAVSLLDLSEYGLLNIPGLEWNTIFDVVQVGGYETTRAQAVWFDVDCHNIDGLEQSHPGQYVIQNNTIQYAFHVDDSLEDIYIAPGESSPVNVRRCDKVYT